MKRGDVAIHSDSDIMGGTPVFIGTRVPLQTLLDYIDAGQPLDDLLEDFPTVTKEQATAALKGDRSFCNASSNSLLKELP